MPQSVLERDIQIETQSGIAITGPMPKRSDSGNTVGGTWEALTRWGAKARREKELKERQALFEATSKVTVLGWSMWSCIAPLLGLKRIHVYTLGKYG